MTFRRAIFLVHRYLGLIAAVFLAFAGITGTALAFRQTLDAALNPDLFNVSQHPAPPPAIVMTHLRADHPDWRIASFALNGRAGESLRAVVAPGPGARPVDMFIDPATGRTIGTRSRTPGWDARHLMLGLHVVHYTLGCGRLGRWAMGGVAVLWLLLTIMGLYMTVPRRLVGWGMAWKTSRPALARRPMVETHRIMGLWTLPVMLVLAYTSASMNFFTETFQPVAETLSPPRQGSPFGRPAATPPAGPVIGYDAAVRIARDWAAQARPGDAPVALDDLPRQNLYGISFAPGGTSRFEGLGRRSCYVDRTSGRIVWIDDPTLDGAGTMAIRSLYPLHTGQVAGLFGMTVDALLGIATAVMALSGVWPWARRRIRRRRRRDQPTISRAAP